MIKKVYLLIAALLVIFLVAGCTSDSNSSKKTVDDGESGDELENGESSNNHANENQDNKQDTTTEENTDNNALDKLANQLKINDKYIKYPTEFPGDKDALTQINKNTLSEYKINFQTESEEIIATFTGTHFSSTEKANKAINDFADGKTVPENQETEVNLGHGIMGYGEGAAGHAYFGWEEGNWTLSISSLTKDQMDHPAIAKIMVEYLENHILPAPKDKGIVYADYPEGADSVDVDIRWQENNMVYQLETSEVPVDALKITVSVE